MLFTVRYRLWGRLDFTKTGVDIGWTTLHIAQQGVNPNLPKWRKNTLCRNGGMDLTKYSLLELNTRLVHSSNVCGTCRRLLLSRGIDVTWFDTRPDWVEVTDGCYHMIDDMQCDDGLCGNGEYPKHCECGGVIHAGIETEDDEQVVYVECGRCGKSDVLYEQHVLMH